LVNFARAEVEQVTSHAMVSGLPRRGAHGIRRGSGDGERERCVVQGLRHERSRQGRTASGGGCVEGLRRRPGSRPSDSGRTGVRASRASPGRRSRRCSGASPRDARSPPTRRRMAADPRPATAARGPYASWRTPTGESTRARIQYSRPWRRGPSRSLPTVLSGWRPETSEGRARARTSVQEGLRGGAAVAGHESPTSVCTV